MPSNPVSLFDSCAKVVRKHDLVRRLPPLLRELSTVRNDWRCFGEVGPLFDECCFGVDVYRAYERKHPECVEKASSAVDASDVARACIVYGDVDSARKTCHLFPEDVRMYGHYILFTSPTTPFNEQTGEFGGNFRYKILMRATLSDWEGENDWSSWWEPDLDQSVMETTSSRELN